MAAPKPVDETISHLADAIQECLTRGQPIVSRTLEMKPATAAIRMSEMSLRIEDWAFNTAVDSEDRISSRSASMWSMSTSDSLRIDARTASF